MTDNLTPYWTYTVDAFKPAMVAGAQLIIWKKGFCSFLYNEQEVLQISVFTDEQNWDEVFFEKLFLNEAMGEHGQKINTIWVAEERNLLIPKNLFEGEASRLWLKRLHHIGSDEDILDNDVPNANTHIVYAYDGKIAALVKKFFPHLHVTSLTRFSIQDIQNHEGEGSVANLILLDSTALLTVSNEGKLLAHQTFEYETVENIVYKVALIAEKNEFDASMVKFNVSGIIQNLEEFSLDLKSFFKEVKVIAGDRGPIIEMIKQIIQCA